MLHLPPPSTTPFPAVLFLHGFTGSKHEVHRLFVTTARELARRSIAALRFDFRGAGDSAGEFHQLCLSSMLQDVAAAMQFVRQRDDINPTSLGILGYSLGGLVAQLALPRHPDLAAVVLWAPVCDPRAAVARKSSSEKTRQLLARGIIDMDGWPVGRRLVLQMQTSRPLRSVTRTRAPVLLLHGDQDETVPPNDSAACEQALRRAGKEVERRLIRGAGHTFDSLELQQQLVSATVQWFSYHLTQRT